MPATRRSSVAEKDELSFVSSKTKSVAKAKARSPKKIVKKGRKKSSSIYGSPSSPSPATATSEQIADLSENPKPRATAAAGSMDLGGGTYNISSTTIEVINVSTLKPPPNTSMVSQIGSALNDADFGEGCSSGAIAISLNSSPTAIQPLSTVEIRISDVGREKEKERNVATPKRESTEEYDSQDNEYVWGTGEDGMLDTALTGAKTIGAADTAMRDVSLEDLLNAEDELVAEENSEKAIDNQGMDSGLDLLMNDDEEFGEEEVVGEFPSSGDTAPEDNLNITGEFPCSGTSAEDERRLLDEVETMVSFVESEQEM